MIVYEDELFRIPTAWAEYFLRHPESFWEWWEERPEVDESPGDD